MPLPGRLGIVISIDHGLGPRLRTARFYIHSPVGLRLKATLVGLRPHEVASGVGRSVLNLVHPIGRSRERIECFAISSTGQRPGIGGSDFAPSDAGAIRSLPSPE